MMRSLAVISFQTTTTTSPEILNKIVYALTLNARTRKADTIMLKIQLWTNTAVAKVEGHLAKVEN